MHLTLDDAHFEVSSLSLQLVGTDPKGQSDIFKLWRTGEGKQADLPFGVELNVMRHSVIGTDVGSEFHSRVK